MKNKTIVHSVFVLLAALAYASCGESSSTAVTAVGEPVTMPPEIKQIIDEAYALKQTGRNSHALEKFEAACERLRAQKLEHSIQYASCLDDRASVMLRLGRTDEAAELFRLASSIASGDSKAASLNAGIRERLRLIEAMKRIGFACNEPPEPPVDTTIPYFPDITAMQDALGGLTRKVADCGSKRTIEAINMRLHITHDGRLLLAYAKDQFAQTPTEKCVATRLFEHLPSISLPPFRACFRGFTVPFMLGPHPPIQKD